MTNNTLIATLAGCAIAASALLDGCGSQSAPAPTSGPAAPAAGKPVAATTSAAPAGQPAPSGNVAASPPPVAPFSAGSSAAAQGQPGAGNSAAAQGQSAAGGGNSRGFFLQVDSPPEDGSVDSADLTVSGTTTPGAVVSVNGDLVDVGSDGSFSTDLQLSEGANDIEVEASDIQGDQQSVIRSIIYAP